MCERDKRMDVIIVYAMDPTTTKSGGTRSYVLNLIQGLTKMGINISLMGVTYDRDFALDTDATYNFIPIVKSQKISGYKFLFNLLLKVPFFHIPKTAIIHVQQPEDMLPFLLFFRKNPKIYTNHGRNYENEMIIKRGRILGTITEIIDKIVVKRVNKIIAVDEKTKNSYVNTFSGLRDKIIVIPVGIDTEIFKPMDKPTLRNKYKLNKNDKIVLYAGRYGKEKRLDLLIRAFKRVQNEILNSKLVLVGEGREKQKLSELATTLDLEGIIFVDTIEHEKIPEIMNCADVFALCSLYEGMPTVVLEALACGVPVVSTDVGDVHKVVKDDETGYIVKLRTEEEISTKLIKVLSDSGRFKENCIRTAQEYSRDIIAKRIVGVYNELLEKE